MLPYYLPNIFSFLNKPALSTEKWGTEELEAQRTITRLMSAYPSIHSSISGLMIYGMNGNVNGYKMDGDEKLNLDRDVTTEKWYQDAIGNGGGFVITGIEDIHSFKGNPFQAIVDARMLRDEDFKPLGVIEIMISPKFIPNIVKSLNLQDVQVTVLAHNGEAIYTSDQELAEQLYQLEVAGNSGAWELDMVTQNGKIAILMQLQADLLGTQVTVASTAELSAKGSALMGGLGIGWWTSPQQLPSEANASSVYSSVMGNEQRAEQLAGWHKAVSLVVGSFQTEI